MQISDPSTEYFAFFSVRKYTSLALLGLITVISDCDYPLHHGFGLSPGHVGSTQPFLGGGKREKPLDPFKNGEKGEKIPI